MLNDTTVLRARKARTPSSIVAYALRDAQGGRTLARDVWNGRLMLGRNRAGSDKPSMRPFARTKLSSASKLRVRDIDYTSEDSPACETGVVIRHRDRNAWHVSHAQFVRARGDSRGSNPTLRSDGDQHG
jgi:hypothetical protein